MVESDRTRLVWLHSIVSLFIWFWIIHGFSCLLWCKQISVPKHRIAIMKSHKMAAKYYMKHMKKSRRGAYFEEIEVNTRVMSKSAYAWPAWHVPGSLHVEIIPFRFIPIRFFDLIIGRSSIFYLIAMKWSRAIS